MKMQYRRPRISASNRVGNDFIGRDWNPRLPGSRPGPIEGNFKPYKFIHIDSNFSALDIKATTSGIFGKHFRGARPANWQITCGTFFFVGAMPVHVNLGNPVLPVFEARNRRNIVRPFACFPQLHVDELGGVAGNGVLEAMRDVPWVKFNSTRLSLWRLGRHLKPASRICQARRCTPDWVGAFSRRPFAKPGLPVQHPRRLCAARHRSR